jgi:predicted transcriptional regulator
MSRRVTLELPDEVLDRAERLAVLTHRDVKQLLAEAVSAMLPPLDEQLVEVRPMAEISDAEVLRLADRRLPPRQDRRLSQLLDRQQVEALTSPERAELLGLMQTYEVQWLQQAEALAEAVRRGLREPLAP